MALGLVAWLGAVTAHAAPPLETYGQLPGFETAAISATGDKLAVIGVINDVRRLLVLTTDSQLLFTGTLGDNKVRSLRWVGDKFVLVRISQTVPLGIGFIAQKIELASVIVINVETSKMYSVFDKRRDVTGGVFGNYGAREREGRWFGYFSTITLAVFSKGFGRYMNDTSPELYEVDLEAGDAKRIALRTEGEGWRDWLVGPAGTVTTRLDYHTKKGDWEIRNSRNTVIAKGTNPLGGISLLGLGRTPGTLIYEQEDEASGGSDWYEVPLDGGAAAPIDHDNVRGIYTDERSGQLLGYAVDGDHPESRFFDARQQAVANAAAEAFPGLDVSLVDWNAAFDRLIVQTNGPGDPGIWWLVDIRTGKATDLGRSYALRAADVGPMRVVPYKAGDGMDLSGILTLPPDRPAKNLPVIMLPHGGPASRDYPAFDWWPQALASRGYAVFQPNFRGSTGFGAAYRNAGKGEWGRKMQTDISDGLAELVKQGLVDPKRACIMGASYGGYAALAGVTLQQGMYRCAVAVAGVTDLKDYYNTKTHNSGHDPTLTRSLQDEIGSGRDLTAVSPALMADRADAPVLLIHGKDDTVVLYDQSTAMESALRKAGKPVELVTMAGEDHWLSKSQSRLAMLKAAVAFVERHNPPDPAPPVPTPAK